MDVVHRRPDPRQQQFAGLGQSDAAGGAVQKPHPKPLLHAAKTLAQAGNRDMLVQRRPAKVFRPGNGHESLEIAEVEIAHCSL
jgi:hypothetical protein